MTKPKKTVPKKAASKKVVDKKAASQKGKANTSGKRESTTAQQPPIRIIIEVVVRNETSNANKFMDVAFDAAVANNFSYSFEKSNCTILKLVVERFEPDNPPDSGAFYTPILDPNNPPKVRVMVEAKQDFPGANGRLTLKYNTKDVFSPTEEIIFSGGTGKINTLVKLPA